MASNFINAIANDIGIEDTELYVSASAKSVVIGCNLSNKLTSTVPVSLKLRRDGVDTYIVKNKYITSGDIFELNKGNKLVLNIGDSIVVSAGVDNSFDAILSILSGVS